MKHVLALALTFALLLTAATRIEAASPGCNGNPRFGCFPERPQLEFLDDGRTMQLLRDFTYIDPQQQTWLSVKGSNVDGASIPRVLWSFVGGPFEGQYRNASIVHDTECDLKQHEWRGVHRMFYHGVRAGGVGLIKSRLMYIAVYQFGPRWNLPRPLWQILPAQAKDHLTRVLVILRRDHRVGKLTLDDLEKKSYEDVRKEVPDDDPDLAMVRKLLEERNAVSSNSANLSRENFREIVKKLDDALYLENDTPPNT